MEVLGFPCNQFGAQESGSDAEIQDFVCARGGKFPVFGKIDVNGADAHPLYKFLKAHGPEGSLTDEIKWNFTIFVCDKVGMPVSRFFAQKDLTGVHKKVEELLSA